MPAPGVANRQTGGVPVPNQRGWRAGTGTPASRTAPRPAGPRNRVPRGEKKRGDGLERRPLVGTARRRRAESRIAKTPEWFRLGTGRAWRVGRERRSSFKPAAVQRTARSYRCLRRSAGTAWNADLRAPRRRRAESRIAKPGGGSRLGTAPNRRGWCVGTGTPVFTPAPRPGGPRGARTPRRRAASR